tara:strand:- start:685 stop:897 length:213 start_codon:yes stop_codon:yes gene_type:complete
MGAKIEMVKRQDDFDDRLKLVEGALEELIEKVEELLQNNTRVHHVDLHEEELEEELEETVEEDEEEKISA